MAGIIKTLYNETPTGTVAVHLTTTTDAIADSSGRMLPDILSSKTDKIANPSSGDLVSVDASGNIQDSRISISTVLATPGTLPEYVTKTDYEFLEMMTMAQ